MRVESRNGRGPSENPAASLLEVCEAVPKSGRRQLWQDTGALHSFDKLALDWLRMVAAPAAPEHVMFTVRGASRRLACPPDHRTHFSRSRVDISLVAFCSERISSLCPPQFSSDRYSGRNDSVDAVHGS